MSKEILILGKETFDKLKPDVQRFIKQQSQQIADLETKLAEKDKAIENWQTMYESVMQTCHNDKEEIESLNKQLTQWTINAGWECGEKEKALRLIENLQQEQIAEMKEHQEAMELADKTITNLVEDNRASQEWYKKQLAESENKHLLDEKEWQDYCAFKHIEPQIKGCLDREREYEKQLADTEEQNKRVLEKLELIVRANQELEKKLAEHNKYFKSFSCEDFNEFKDFISTFMLTPHEEQTLILELKQQLTEKEKLIEDYSAFFNQLFNQDKISFALEQLEKVKEYALELFKKFCQSTEYHSNKSLVGRRFIEYYPFNDFIDNQIKQLKERKNESCI